MKGPSIESCGRSQCIEGDHPRLKRDRGNVHAIPRCNQILGAAHLFGCAQFAPMIVEIKGRVQKCFCTDGEPPPITPFQQSVRPYQEHGGPLALEEEKNPKERRKTPKTFYVTKPSSSCPSISPPASFSAHAPHKPRLPRIRNGAPRSS